MLYIDFDMKLRGHPVKQDLLWVVDSQAVANSIKMLVNTNYHERPFASEKGANIRALLFELAETDTATAAKERINRVVERWEPRAIIQDISSSINHDANLLTVNIRFSIANTTTISQVQISLKVVR